MNEDTVNESNNQSGEGQGTAAAPENKTFTQEEVNQIVSNRLQREREKAGNEQDASLVAKEVELSARESLIAVKEQLIEKGMPLELAGIIRGANEKEITQNLEILKKYISKEDGGKETERKSIFKIGSGSSSTESAKVDPYRRVMGLK